MLLSSGFSAIANEKSKIDSLLERAVDLFSNDRELAYRLETRALDLSVEIDYLSGIVRSKFYIGYYFEFNKNYAESIGNYLDVINTGSGSSMEDSLYIVWKIKAYRNLGNIFSDHEAFELAGDFYSKGIEFSKSIQNRKEQMSLLYNLHKSQYEAEYYSQSKNTLLKLKKISIENSKEYYRSINGLALINTLTGNLVLAEKQYLELLQVAQESNNLLYQSFAFHNLGDIYSKLDKKEKSIFNFNKAIDIKTQMNASHSLFLSYKNLGDLYSKFNNPNRALANYNEAMSLVDGIKNHPDYFYFYEELSKIHETLGNSALAEKFRGTFMEELAYYTENQNQINSSSQQYNMQLIVSNYYEELEAQRKAQQSERIFIAIIVGLSLMLFLFVSYHFVSKYQLNRVLTQNLSRLEWAED